VEDTLLKFNKIIIMELTQAIDVLKRSASAKQEDVNALNLAVSVLEGTFAPELKVLETAKQAVIDKDKIITDLSTEKVTLETRVQELEPLVESPKPTEVVEPVQGDAPVGDVPESTPITE
jgi:hypothetical protein